MAAQGAESKVPEVLTPRTVAERWAMSDKGIYHLIRTGKLRAFKLGGKLLRVPRAAVEECERAQASASAEDDPALSRDRENGGRTHLDPLTRAKLRNLRERFTP
jgi:excisionase family DNA binding protein